MNKLKLAAPLLLAAAALVGFGSPAQASATDTLTVGARGAFADTRPGCGLNPCSFAYLPPGSSVTVYGSVVGSDGQYYDVVYVPDWRGVWGTGYVPVADFPGSSPVAPPRPVIGVGW